MNLYIKKLGWLLTLVASQAMAQPVLSKITVPLGGNSWVTVKAPNGQEEVTDNGWVNWENPGAVWSTYISIPKAGTLNLAALINVPSGTSQLKWTINGVSKVVSVTGNKDKEYAIGTWTISQPGYLKIDAQGTGKTGPWFATIRELRLGGTATQGSIAFVKNNQDNYFYWGRRGPSVHINYNTDEIDDEFEWF